MTYWNLNFEFKRQLGKKVVWNRCYENSDYIVSEYASCIFEETDQMHVWISGTVTMKSKDGVLEVSLPTVSGIHIVTFSVWK